MCLNSCNNKAWKIRPHFLAFYLALNFVKTTTQNKGLVIPATDNQHDEQWSLTPVDPNKENILEVDGKAAKAIAPVTEKPAPTKSTPQYIPYKQYVKTSKSKMERVAARMQLYQLYLEKEKKKCKKPEKPVNYFDYLQEYNKKKHYVSKGTCDRRNLKICKNACLKTYKSVCGTFKCEDDFKEEVKDNCRDICERRFTIEFNNNF